MFIFLISQATVSGEHHEKIWVDFTGHPSFFSQGAD
jgi:hypothetical protein